MKEAEKIRTQEAVKTTQNINIMGEIYKIEDLLGKKLRVYVDKELNKKYITNFAASELGLITYKQACNDSEGFYIVTDKLIQEIENRGCKIIYIIIKDNKDFEIDFYRNINFLDQEKEFSNIKNASEQEFINNILKQKKELYDNDLNSLKKK